MVLSLEYIQEAIDTGISKEDFICHCTSMGISEDELIHWGVPGMRWGKRKGDSSSSNSSNKNKKSSNKKDTNTKRKKKKVSEMSDEELKVLIERLKLETQYKQLTEANKSKGQKALEDALLQTGKNVVSDVTRKGVNTGVDELIKIALGK